MIALFHRAKHWQLFTILVGGIIFLELISVFYLSATFNESLAMNRPPDMSRFFWFFVPMMLLSITMSFGWQWSVGAGLRDKLPRGVQMNFKLYRAFTIVPVAAILLYLIFMYSIFASAENLSTSGNIFHAFQVMLSMLLGVIVMIPIMLFAAFCTFYNFYYCAKTLKSIELGREAVLDDYIGYFFLFWFNFVGYWFIQPSVNSITSEGWTPPPTPPGYEPPIDLDPAFDPIQEKEVHPRGDLLKTKNHDAFEHDDDFDGLF